MANFNHTKIGTAAGVSEYISFILLYIYLYQQD